MDKLKPVHIRLFEDDIAKAKAQAAKAGIPWQTYLRGLIREALSLRQQERKIR